MEMRLQTEFWLLVRFPADFFSPVVLLTLPKDYFTQVTLFFSDYVKHIRNVRVLYSYAVYQSILKIL